MAPEAARAEILEIHLGRPEELSTRPWGLSSHVFPVPQRGQTLFIRALTKASIFAFRSDYRIGNTSSFLSLNVSTSWMNNLVAFYKRLMWFFVFEERFVDIRVKYVKCVILAIPVGARGVEEEDLRKSLTTSSVSLLPQPERTKFPILELHIFLYRNWAFRIKYIPKLSL